MAFPTKKQCSKCQLALSPWRSSNLWSFVQKEDCLKQRSIPLPPASLCFESEKDWTETCWAILSGLGQAVSVNVPSIECAPSFREIWIDLTCSETLGFQLDVGLWNAVTRTIPVVPSVRPSTCCVDSAIPNVGYYRFFAKCSIVLLNFLLTIQCCLDTCDQMLRCTSSVDPYLLTRRYFQLMLSDEWCVVVYLLSLL